MFSILDRQRTIASENFSRWLVPPAALSIHLAIGQVYGFSVFKIPLQQLIGVTSHVKDQDWDELQTAWIFSVAIVVLGLSAALFGTWLERVGPRKAMFVSACCFCGGFLVGALGVYWHQLWLVYLGYGVIGGIGLGIGYISPVSTLIKWFPDRPGMATGMAIMGFGGGAMIGSPLGQSLLVYFHGLNPKSAGVAETWVTMATLYFILMMYGVATVRLPRAGWKPAGYVAPAKPQRLITTANVTANSAIQTPQFYLLWAMLFLNVTAGIGILEKASPMIQEMFRLTPDEVAARTDLVTSAKQPASLVTPAAAAGFVGLLSIFNMAGRFFWSSASDYIGRKPVYAIYFLLGACLYVAIPATGQMRSVPLFVAVCAVIISMYGGGFATIPAYLRDLFGTVQVGAIHGRLLTAWSAAGVAGPLLVNYLNTSQRERGMPVQHIYDLPMYLMAGCLAVGAICDFLVTPVNSRFHMTEQPARDVPAVAPAVGVGRPAGT